MTVKIIKRKAMPRIMMKPIGPHVSALAKGNHVFIPKMEAINIGTVNTIVIEVKNFMTLFRLLLIIEAKASNVPVKMLL